jgi:hypothetical protein
MAVSHVVHGVQYCCNQTVGAVNCVVNSACEIVQNVIISSILVFHYSYLFFEYISQDLFTRSLVVGMPLCCETNPKVEAKKPAHTIDRTTVIPVETSMKYLTSEGMYYKS